jgi:hypothetical protein
MPNIVHQDIMQLTASPEKVREFLRDPERIAEYYPDLIEYGTFEEGKTYWCRGEAGVALFEILEERCTDIRVSMSIMTNIAVEKPYTVESIKADVFISMVEEWDVIPKDGGSQITKTWLDVELHQMKDLPIVEMIKETAVEEHSKIVTAWNKAAS